MFTPEYPTITPMTMCDATVPAGGWYIVTNRSQTEVMQQQNNCMSYRPHFKQTPNQQYDKKPDIDVTANMPNVPVSGGTRMSSDNNNGGTIVRGGGGGVPAWATPSVGGMAGISPGAVELPSDMRNQDMNKFLPAHRDMQCSNRWVYGTNMTTINAQQADALCPAICEQDNRKKWTGKFMAHNQVRPGVVLSSCECCASATPPNCVDLQIPPGGSLGPAFVCGGICDQYNYQLNRRDQDGALIREWTWNNEYTNNTCRCCR